MNEQQARDWMSSFTRTSGVPRLPDPEQVWILAQLEARCEERRAARAPLFWVDAAAKGLVGVALATVAVWLGGLFSSI